MKGITQGQGAFAERASGVDGRTRLLGLLGLLDRRVRFHDLSRFPAPLRRVRSPVIQFYSAVDNIGNYTPVLGIQQMLGFQPDTWNVHRVPVDFEFINRRYRAAIIGGAGLLHRVFEPFWRDLRQHCQLPMIVWGVGGCFPRDQKNPCVDRAVVRDVFDRCELVDVRDELTANHFGRQDVHVGICPTVVWADKYAETPAPGRGAVLFAAHDAVPAAESEAIWRAIQRAGWAPLRTDNVQRRRWGLMDILDHRYRPARLVVCSRLHGAIIAFGLGIPYVGLPWDAKLRAFQERYGNGVLAESVEELPGLVRDMPSPSDAHRNAQRDAAAAFGLRALEWVQAHTG